MSESTDEDKDDDEGEAGSDRRGDPRHLACFPAHVEVGDNGVARTALIRDLSVSGALLLTRARVKVGDVVKLSLYLKEGLEPVLVSSRVVREEKRSSELVHPWTKAVAVQFETAMPEVEAEAKALADRQAALNAGPRRGSSPPSKLDPVNKGVTRLAAPLLLVAALQAPFQCGSRVPPEHRTEDDAAEVLYKLAEKFKTEGNAGAQAETLRFLMERYPTSRFAEAAKIDLEKR